MATGFEATTRKILNVSGADCTRFLQDLVTNDISQGGLVYTALLTPQGKYLFDFFMLSQGDEWLLDVEETRASALMARLNMYKLRADVTLVLSDLRVFQVWDSELGYSDPRHPELGRRLYQMKPPEMTVFNGWDALRIAHCIPETGKELIADDSYILESCFERLNGVDFKKGCYVGQEVTARMKHKTELRKGLASVVIEGEASAGDPIIADGKEAGVLRSVLDGAGIAYLRFDRAKGEMTAGRASVRRV